MRRAFELKTERRRDRETERQRDRETKKRESFLLSVAPFLLLSVSLSLCLSVSPSPTPHSINASAQRRPILRPATRDYFAGKFVLITRDERPQSLQEPRMLARVADHDLTTPPSRVLAPGADANALIEWAKGVDYAEVDGVIVCLDAIADGPPQPERPDLVKWIRARRPSIAIYAFTTGSSDRSVQWALNLSADSTLDFLLISGEGASRPNLSDEIAARKLNGKVAIEPDIEAATMLLLSRILNHRFGFAPKIFPVF